MDKTITFLAKDTDKNLSLYKFLSSNSGIALSVKSTCDDIKFCKAF